VRVFEKVSERERERVKGMEKIAPDGVLGTRDGVTGRTLTTQN
jgi:hypothetical protein